MDTTISAAEAWDPAGPPRRSHRATPGYGFTDKGRSTLPAFVPRSYRLGVTTNSRAVVISPALSLSGIACASSPPRATAPTTTPPTTSDTYWAYATFALSATASEQTGIAFQDGGNIAVMSHRPGQPWVVTIGRIPWPCPGDIPAALLHLWALPISSYCSPSR